MKKISVLLLINTIIAPIFAEHGGNNTHVVCVGTVAAPNTNEEGQIEIRKIALFYDNQRVGSVNWFGIVRGVQGLQDYVGVGKENNSGVRVTVSNTEASQASDVLFDGKVRLVDNRKGLELKGKLKVSIEGAMIDINTVFDCADATPLGIPNPLPAASQ